MLKIGLKGLIPGCKVCWTYHNHKGPKSIQKTNRTIMLDVISNTGAELGVRLRGLVSIRLWKQQEKRTKNEHYSLFQKVCLYTWAY